MPHYEVPVHDRLAAHLRHGGARPASTWHSRRTLPSFDHGAAAFPDAAVRCKLARRSYVHQRLGSPLPAAKRCFALGEAVPKAIHRWPQKLRGAVLASGSFSLEVGGPQINPGEAFGVPDPEWAKTIQNISSRAN